MAGSAMVFTEIRHSSVKKIKAAWTSDDTTGAVSGTTTYPYGGKLIGAITVPDGVAAPSANYDIAVNDDDSVDVALGALANRSDTDTEYVAEASMAGVANSKLTIAITAAGNSKKGTVYLYIR
jgi:hypothetical protein